MLSIAALALATAASAQELRPRAVIVRLDDQTKWQVLKYSKLPPHRIRFSSAGLEMAVEASAMPLIYALPERLRVSSIRVKGCVEGQLQLPPARQGEKGFDDYVFRIGLVEPGISKIHFFNVGAEKAQIGREREHPLSDLIVEKVVAVPRADGRFDFAHTLDRPLQAIAVWLSSDGDDTGSQFTVLVEEIELR